MKERRYDMDWMRVIAMLSVFLLHCMRFFDTNDWQLKVPLPQQSEAVQLLEDFLLGVWQLPLFFLVSGFATWYSLRRRNAGQFLVERVKRLLIPLYTVGMFILVVPQEYIQRASHGEINLTFWQWLPSYYVTLPRRLVSIYPTKFLDPVNLVPYTFSGHLWFLQMLLLVSLLALPLLFFLRSDRGQRLIGRLAAWCARPGGIFLFVVPLAIFEIGLRWLPVESPRTWADFFWYAGFFLIGYIIAADSRFADSIRRSGWMALVLWVGIYWVVGGIFTMLLGFDTAPGNGFSLLYVLWRPLQALMQFSAVAFFLSLGVRYLNSNNRLLVYSNEAVLPFYLFHQTIIQIVGWFVLPLATSNAAKFLIITVVSFPLVLLLYEVFVRRIEFMRFLFGMAAGKRQIAMGGAGAQPAAKAT